MSLDADGSKSFAFISMDGSVIKLAPKAQDCARECGLGDEGGDGGVVMISRVSYASTVEGVIVGIGGSAAATPLESEQTSSTDILNTCYYTGEVGTVMCVGSKAVLLNQVAALLYSILATL